MSLRTASRLILLGSVVALGFALLVGHSSWREIQANTARAELVDQIYSEYYRFKPQLEEAVLVERSPEAVQALRDQIDSFAETGQQGRLFDGDIAALLLELEALFQQFSQEFQSLPAGAMPSAEELLRDENRIRLIDSRIQRALLESEQAAETRIRAAYQATLIRLLVATALLGLGGFLVGWTIHSRMRRPLDTLMQGVAALSDSKDLESAAIELNSRDEFGELARALNSMSRALVEQRQELIEAVERFNHLAWTLEDLFWIFDGNRNEVVYLSPAFESLYGFKPDGENLNPDYWLDRIPPEDHASYRKFLDGWRDGLSEGVYRFRRPDGRLIWVQDKAFAVTDHGQPTGIMVGVARDITKEVAIREDLKRRIDQQHALYEASQIMHDSQQSIGAVCQRVVDLLADSIDPARLGSARMELMGEVYASEYWSEAEIVTRSPVTVLGRDEGNVQLGCVAGGDDSAIGEMGFRESELFALDLIAANLSAEINKRKIESRLWQDEKLKAVGELTGGIAHDFNNLLTVIIGNIEMLLEDIEPGDPNGELLEMAMQASNHAAKLTSRLLAYARRQPLDPQNTNVNELLNDVLPMLERTLGENIRIKLETVDEPWIIRVDKTQLSASVMNLVINARDAMQNGGTLIIETRNEKVSEAEADEFLDLVAGDYLMISVTDDGCGIPRDNLARVLEPFFSTKSKTAGTGLGLSMAYGFTRQSGGNITVYSEEGIGTTVKLYLPRIDAATHAEASTPTSEVELKGKRILLVEDDNLVKSYVSRLLTGLGVDVVPCSDSEAALRSLKGEQRYDLLLSDVVMPGTMDGIELAEEAKTIDPELSVLFMSGYPRERFASNRGLAEDALLLNKPFRREDLTAMLRRVWPAPSRG
jgi:PAS domain S-box-containing protein